MKWAQPIILSSSSSALLGLLLVYQSGRSNYSCCRVGARANKRCLENSLNSNLSLFACRRLSSSSLSQKTLFGGEYSNDKAELKPTTTLPSP